MWQPLGSPNSSNGLNNYSNPRKNAAQRLKLSSAGTGSIAPYCESNAPRQGDSRPTELLQSTEIAITSSHWIISRTCKQKWLGNSTARLSDCDRIAIHIILHLRIVLQSGGFFAMATALLLVFGMLTWKDSPKVLHFDNSRPVAQLRGWR